MITSPARGADRVVGVSGPPPRALAASTALVVLLLGGVGPAPHYRIHPVPGLGLRDGHHDVRLVGADDGPRGPRRLLCQRRVHRLPAGLSAGAVAHRRGVPGVRGWRPGRHRDGPGQAPADARRHRGRLAAVPPRAGLGVAVAPRRGARPGGRGAVRVQPGHAGTTRRCGARPIPSARWCCCWVSRRSSGATARAPRSWGSSRRSSSPSSGSCSSRSWRSCCCDATCCGRGRDRGTCPGAPARLRGWLAREQGPWRLVTSGLVALVTFHVLALPFGMGIPEYLELMGRTASGYEYLTVNAFNPWALVGLDGATPLAWAMPFWPSDTVPLVAGVSGVRRGRRCCSSVASCTASRTSCSATSGGPSSSPRSSCALAFFVLPTRVHERYLMPVFALVPLLAVTSRAWLVVLVGLAIASLINLHAVLTYDLWGTENVIGLPLGEVDPDTHVRGGVRAARDGRVPVRGLAAVEGRRPAAGRPGAAGQRGGGHRDRARRDARHGTPAGRPGAGRHLRRPDRGPARAMPTWDEPVRGPSALDRIIDRVTPPAAPCATAARRSSGSQPVVSTGWTC